MKLSDNFTLQEFLESDVADAISADNYNPSGHVIHNLKFLCCTVLQPLRDHYRRPVVINSGWRCEELERALTRSGYLGYCKRMGIDPDETASWNKYYERKSHPRGEAADIEVPGVSNAEVWLWLQDNIPEFDQLILEHYHPSDLSFGWVHVSYVSDGTRHNRHQVFTIG